MMQLLEFFLAEGFEITFSTTAGKTEFMADLDSLGIISETIALNNSSFDRFLAEVTPDVVLFDRFMMEEQFGWRVAEGCPEAIRILDTEDLHFLRKARQEAAKTKTEVTPSLLFSDVAKREIASIYRCDLSLIISEAEMQLLRETFGVPGNLLFYLPFMLKTPSKEQVSNLLKFEERQDFISIGNFLHEPNKDAVLTLKKDIWPLIKKKLPEARIHIFGAYIPQQIRELHNEKEGFLVAGRAASAKTEIGKARLLLAPLRFGAGLKGKFSDAMQVGTPTITTALGAEAMAGDLPWNGGIEDVPEEFARAAVELYSHKESWEVAQQNGFRILQQNFSEAIHRERFREQLRVLTGKLEEHRNSNFTGLMLQHHSMSSTKFLAKYIEAKTKNRP